VEDKDSNFQIQKLIFIFGKIPTIKIIQIKDSKGHRQADTDPPMRFCGGGTSASKVLL